MPINDSRYALLERLLGRSGNIASTITTRTQALTENCIVCRSQRKGVELGVDAVDAPVALVVDPELLDGLRSVVDDDGGGGGGADDLAD